MNQILTPMLAALFVVAAPVSAAPQPAPKANLAPVDPAALAIAHQILAIGIPAEKRSQMFTSVLDSLSEQVRKSAAGLSPTKDKDFQAILDRSTQRLWDGMKPIMNAALPDIFESMARAYARDFSVDDLNALLAFVKTPAGQHFFERSPLILKDPDVQASQQRMMAQIGEKLPGIMRQDKQDIEDYLAKKAEEEKASEPKPVT